jgi:hypothetical protein
MSKTPISPAELGTPPAIIAHTYMRLRGAQTADVTVYHARSDLARVTLTWGGILMTFLNAQAAQGVLEGISAARNTLIYVPAEVGPAHQDPYDQPTIAVEWTRRPAYAVMPRTALTSDKRSTLNAGPTSTWARSRSRFSTAPPSTVPSMCCV